MILAACVLFTSVPINALSIPDINVTENTANEKSTESMDTSSTELATDSNASSENISISEKTTLNSEEISSNDIESNVSEDTLFSKEKLNSEKAANNNWDLDICFYDSAVDNGQTALESIDWNASNGSYGEGKHRTITMQINYSHYDSLESYNPGDITITVPNLLRNEGQKVITYFPDGGGFTMSIGNSECLIWTHEIYANTNGEEDYDWNCTFNRDSKGHISEYVFTNDIPFEEIVNFEGSLQISYILIPREETPEKFDSECTHSFNESGKASLTVSGDENAIESNEVSFNYTRTYTHPWKYKQYNIQKGAEVLKAYDGLPQGASDYIWVKYTFKDNVPTGTSKYPEIYALNTKMKDNIPSECKVYNKDMQLMTPENGNTYIFNDNFIYVAYPRSIYNKENSNLNITNKVELWGTYEDKTEEECLAEGSASINLSEYEITYKGEPLEVDKKATSELGGSDYINCNMTWDINVKAIYTGDPLTIKIEDPELVTDLYGGDSYFTKATFPGNVKNLNGLPIKKNKYDCELWIKPQNSNEYVLYDTFKNPDNDKSWTFSSSTKVAGFYFLVKDLEESFIGTIKVGSYHPVGNGNFNGTVENEAILSSGLKSVEAKTTTYFNAPSGIWNQVSTSLRAVKKGTSLSKKRDDDFYTGQYTIGSTFSNSGALTYNPWFNRITYGEYNSIKGFKMYDLLPYGVEITSTNEEILNSLRITDYNGYRNFRAYIARNDDCTSIDYASSTELINNTDTVINIKENWNNTGRTKIEIIGTFKKPIFTGPTDLDSYSSESVSFRYDINYKISVDDLLENKKTLLNYVDVEHLESSNYITLSSTRKDTQDINENNSITDYLAYAYYQVSVNSGLSTHQGISKYVKTNKQKYSIGTVESDLNSEYTYKLRVTTGKNDVTNLILYDSIEEKAWDKDNNMINAFGNNKHWNGEFLGVDTSYAEENGYSVKTYYSENKEAGNLYNEDGSLNDDYKEYVDENGYTYTYGEKQTITSPNWPNNYNSSMTEAKNYWEVSEPGATQLEITFDSTCKLESASYDYLRFYDKNGTNITSSVCGISDNKIGGTSMAGKTYTVDSDYVKITMRSDSSGQYKGFLADIRPKMIAGTIYGTDKSKVKSLAFEYLDKDGNKAIIPKESVTYVEVKMKSPNTEYKTYAYNGCRSQWNVIDETTKLPVDGITGMHSNIVRVALPTSVEKEPTINISFIKEIEGTDEAWNYMKLDKNNTYKFQVFMKNTETGDIISVPIDNKNTVIVNEVPIGTYVITEKDDMYFDFVSMETLNSVEGVTFEKVGNDYVLTITENASEEETLQIKVNNKIEPDRPYEDKEEKENLFSWKDESTEPTTYIVYWYDNDGNYIKAPETRSGTVGITAYATSGDKNVPGYEYDKSNPLNIENKVLSKDEDNELKLYFNKL